MSKVMAPSPKRVLVTGAAGQIGYSIVFQIAKGDVFGPNQPVELVLLDIPMMANVLEGVVFELVDCSLPLLRKVIPCTNEHEAFKDVDAVFLIGAMPRKEGMERKDLLAANVKIFKSQGQSLANFANPDCKVLVVGNPANTNAFICAKYAAPKIPAKNIAAMTRLDHNRAVAQVALRAGVHPENVNNVIIWGNHSSTQFPDISHATVTKDGKSVKVADAVKDPKWFQDDFISLIQKRGGEIIKRRKLSSAMSAAKAACDHMRDWFAGTKQGSWVSMAVCSDGSYNIPQGTFYSFPVHIDPQTKNWSIVQGLSIDSFARGKMDITLKELTEEANEAVSACT